MRKKWQYVEKNINEHLFLPRARRCDMIQAEQAFGVNWDEEIDKEYSMEQLSAWDKLMNKLIILSDSAKYADSRWNFTVVII